MATDKQRRANEIAQALGYASDYARRKERAQRMGFSSPRTQRNASEERRGVQRDYQMERERREIRARGRGFSGVSQQTVQRRSGKTAEEWLRDKALAEYGVSEFQFNRIRKQNRDWAKKHNSKRMYRLNRYSLEVDKRVSDWSAERVGYIVAFNGANRLGEMTADRPVKEWWALLAEYGGDIEADTYDAGYGEEKSIKQAIAAVGRER